MEVKKTDSSLNIWNCIFLSVAILLVSRVFYLYKFDNENFIPEYFVYLSFGLPSILLIFQYRQLRKLNVYTSWTILSFILFVISFFLKNDKTLLLGSGANAALILKGPFVFLLNYIVLNTLSKKYYAAELALPARTSFYNSEEGRNNNVYDYLGLFLGLFEIIIVGKF